jgi:hypothetical protein
MVNCFRQSRTHAPSWAGRTSPLQLVRSTAREFLAPGASLSEWYGERAQRACPARVGEAHDKPIGKRHEHDG